LELIDEVEAAHLAGNFLFTQGRSAAILRAVILLESGELLRFRDLLDRLRPSVARDPPSRCYLECSEHTYRTKAGDFAGIEADLDRLWEVSRNLGLSDVSWAVLRFRVFVDTLHGRVTRLPDLETLGASHDPAQEAECRLQISRQRLVHGDPDDVRPFDEGVGLRLAGATTLRDADAVLSRTRTTVLTTATPWTKLKAVVCKMGWYTRTVAHRRVPSYTSPDTTEPFDST
jgi:hypothetical protein